MTPALSLFTIEESLTLLAETREAAEAEGDAAAVAECDKALAQYLTAEAAKVNSYAALIRRVTAEAEQCEAEAARLIARAKGRRGFVDRLKATALEVMQRFGVKELRSATNTLRVHGNSGAQPLDWVPVKEMPVEFVTATVTMPLSTWKEIVQRASEPGKVAWRVVDTPVSLGCDKERIRKALAEKVTCTECNGVGAPWNNSASVPCPRCDGTGLVPRTIPGAKLLPRGSHLRCE